MRFQRLLAFDLYSFENLDLNFSDYIGGTTIILGKNLDEKTANGAGKSNILRIIYFVLWNKDVKGVPVGKIIRNNSEGGMIVRLTFEDRGDVFTITRYKDYNPNHKKNVPIKDLDGKDYKGSGVDFWINNQVFNADSGPKTNKTIIERLRMSPDLFLNSVLTQQKSKKNFLTSPDSEKKKILSEILDLDCYEVAFKEVKKECTEIEGQITTINLKIENVLKNIEEKKLLILDLIEKENSFKKENSQKIKSLKDYLETKKKEIPEKEKLISQSKESLDKININSDDEKTLSEELLKLQEELKQSISLKQELEKSTTELSKLNEVLTQAKTKLDISKDSIIKNSKDIESESSQLVKEDFDIDNLMKEKDRLSIEKKGKQNELSLYNKNKNELDLINQKKINLDKQILDIDSKLEEEKKSNCCSRCLRSFTESESELIKKISEEATNQKNKLSESILSLDKDLSRLNDYFNITINPQNEIVNLDSLLTELDKSLSSCKLIVQKNKSIHENIEKKVNQIKEFELTIQKAEEFIKIRDGQKQERTLNIKRINDLLSTFKDKELELHKTNDQLRVIAQKKQDRASIENLIKIHSKSIEDIDTDIQEKTKNIELLKTAQNPFEELRKKETTKLENFESENKELLSKKEEKEEYYSYLQFWKFGFSPKGIRSFITDDILSLLTQKVNENLFDLYDGTISIEFSPEKTTASSGTSNEISTTVFKNGDEFYIDLISGGEEQRTILATDLALTDVAESRSGTIFNLKFLDEPFEGICPSGQIKSLTLFARLAKDRDGFFIISHDEKFQHLCNKAIYVIKKNGVSKIVSRNEFESSEEFSPEKEENQEKNENNSNFSFENFKI